GGQSGNEKRQQQDGRQQERQIDPPPFGLRIKAVNELRDLRLDERPARSDRLPRIGGQTRGSVLAFPHRIEEEKTNGGNNEEPYQCGADESQQRVARRVEQANLHEAEQVCRRDGGSS